MASRVKVAKLNKLKWSREKQEVGQGVRVLEARGPSNHAYFILEVPFVSEKKKPFDKLLKLYPSYLARRETESHKAFETESLAPCDISVLERIAGKQLDKQWLIESVRFPLEASPKTAIFTVRGEPKIASNGRRSSIRRLPTRETILEWSENAAYREAESAIVQIVDKLNERMPKLAEATDQACEKLIRGAIEQELKNARHAAKVRERSKAMVQSILVRAREQIEEALRHADKEISLAGLGSTPLSLGTDHITYQRRSRGADAAEIDSRIPKLVERLKQELQNIESGVAPVPVPLILVSASLLGDVEQA